MTIRPFYSRDGITIYNADCRDILPTSGIVSVIDPGSVDLVLTDPPYGHSQSDQRRSQRSVNDPGRDSGFAMIHGDDEPFDPSLVLAFSRVVLFGANHFADRLPTSTGWCVWDKRNGATPDDNADAELIWTNIPGVVRMYRQCWRGFTREGDSQEPRKHVHPTQKPVNLMMWLLNLYTKPDDLILDPYMGSGPVAVACQKMARRYIGIELDATYCAAACHRLQQTAMNLEPEPASRAGEPMNMAIEGVGR